MLLSIFLPLLAGKSLLAAPKVHHLAAWLLMYVIDHKSTSWYQNYFAQNISRHYSRTHLKGHTWNKDTLVNQDTYIESQLYMNTYTTMRGQIKGTIYGIYTTQLQPQGVYCWVRVNCKKYILLSQGSTFCDCNEYIAESEVHIPCHQCQLNFEAGHSTVSSNHCFMIASFQERLGSKL